MKQKNLLIALAVLIVLIGGYFLLNRNNEVVAPETEQTNNTGSNTNDEDIPRDTTNTNSPASIPTKNTLVIGQQSAGTSINIDNVYLEKPGFIVIHAIKDDAPSTVVGSSGWLNAGPGQDISFRANLKAGTTYFALLYSDDGDKKFNIVTDLKLPLYSTQSKSYNDRGVVQFTVAK